MADKRINALTNTATTAASDDYLALDGSANGTRKILASNVANNVTDVVFGSGGPSAKSSIDARAARQGLVFDGATASNCTTSIPAFGTGNFTVCAWLNVADLSTRRAWIGGETNAFASSVVTSGSVWTTKENVVDNTGSTTLLTAGKFNLVVYTRSGTTGTYYINGVSSNSITDANNYSVGSTKIGSTTGGAFAFNGQILGPMVYNRALSAAEVVSLFEAGVPAGADYNTASNTAINSSAFTNFNYNSFSGASATGFSAQNTSGTTEYAQGNPLASTDFKNGNIVRVFYDLTLTSGQLPQVALGQVGAGTQSAWYALTAGTGNYVDIVVTTANAVSTNIAFRSTALSSYTIANVSAKRLGLLLAPDAGQAGGGLTWYDTSGNSANITLPASGVSWNVPTSAKTASGWTFGGNLTVSGTGAVNGAGNIGALSVATTSETALAGPATWSNKHVLLGGVANGTAVTGYAVAVNQSNNDIYTFALAPGVAWRDIRHQAANHYFHNSGSTSPSLTISSTATTLAGNLTVSGTGTSSFAGNLLVTNSKFSFWDTGDQATYGYFEAGHFTNGTFIGTVAGSNTASDLLRFGTTNTERMRLNSSGNLLLGTTTDGGNGKLQLATHTTSAGGIGFGTDTSLYRESSGTLSLNNSSGDARLYFYNTGVVQGKIESASSSFYVTASAGSLILRSGGPVTALTLDSSQNATFAGRVKVSGNAAVPSGTQQTFIGADATNGAQMIGQGSTNDVSIYNSAGNIALRIPTGTQNVTVNGSLAISNTVTAAASVASTHKVTISIGGVTYYLLASNV